MINDKIFFLLKESKIVNCKEVFEIKEKVIKIFIYKAIHSPYALYHVFNSVTNTVGDMKECQIKPI